MSKTIFHNAKSIDHSIIKKKLSPALQIDKKNIVDINKLLNRIKIDQVNETKEKIIFYSLIILGVVLFGCFITLLK